MARKFRELEAGMSAEAITTSDTIYNRLKETMALEELRDALRMTQQELADKMGVTKRMVANYESDSEGPVVERLTAIAQALNVTVSYLLGESTLKTIEPEVPPSLRKHVEKLRKLPPKDQKAAIRMIDALAAQNDHQN